MSIGKGIIGQLDVLSAHSIKENNLALPSLRSMSIGLSRVHIHAKRDGYITWIGEES